MANYLSLSFRTCLREQNECTCFFYLNSKQHISVGSYSRHITFVYSIVDDKLESWFLPKPPKVPPLAFKSQPLISGRLSLSVIRTRAVYACQCNRNEMERARNTRDVRGGAMTVRLRRHARSKRSTRKVAYAARPFSTQVHSSLPTVLGMRYTSQSFAGSL